MVSSWWRQHGLGEGNTLVRNARFYSRIVDPHITDRFRYDGYKLVLIDQCSHPVSRRISNHGDFCSACRAKSILPRVPKWNSTKVKLMPDLLNAGRKDAL